MKDKKGDSNNKITEKIDLEKELSSLVSKKVIPSKIAQKLEKKLKERNVELTREQLYTLVNKIREVIIDIKSGKKPMTGRTNSNMQKLVETIERLDERLTNIESGRPSKTRIVKTSDIQVPGKTNNYEWDMDPLMDIPNYPESIIVLMKWLQYLVDRCGHSNLPDVLDYYVDIEWISEDAKISLLDYSQGLTEETKKEGTKNIPQSNLLAKDHIQSLIFIQKLKGIDFDKHFLDRIDGEISRITKKLDASKFK